MPEEKTESVELTLDESGQLCNMLMKEIMALRKLKPDKQSTLFTPDLAARIALRWERLHAKLAAANDKLIHN